MPFRTLLGLLLLLVAPAAAQDRSDLDAFVRAFPKTPLPLTIDQARRASEVRLVPLDPALTARFTPEYDSLAQAFIPLGRMGAAFAVARLPLSERYTTLVVKYVGPAGGYDDSYYLLTLAPDGRPVSCVEVGRFAGDAGGRVSTVTAIAASGRVEVELTEVETDAVTLEEVGRKVKRRAYDVGEEGRIRRASSAD